MKRSIIVGGSVGAGVLLILMAFPTIVNAQATKTDGLKTNIVQQIKEKIENNIREPFQFLTIKNNNINIFDYILALLKYIFFPILYGIFYLLGTLS